ncbi:MBOAT, membrane-bound O-acyltransferase family protein [Leishmania donovani]|uniref:MBOAT, membrane-bound O-acyltransferase family protein n=1 Tax=Leishmania donovani TaxID=5661 RepID=A0A504XY08_LEIDO|nr:MBOAT, membrane-bound O-acyltransferase family protein [Leishmania donovani]
MFGRRVFASAPLPRHMWAKLHIQNAAQAQRMLPSLAPLAAVEGRHSSFCSGLAFNTLCRSSATLGGEEGMVSEDGKLVSAEIQVLDPSSPPATPLSASSVDAVSRSSVKTGVAGLEEDTSAAPGFSSPERLFYAVVTLGFLLRSFLIAALFFTSNINFPRVGPGNVRGSARRCCSAHTLRNIPAVFHHCHFTTSEFCRSTLGSPSGARRRCTAFLQRSWILPAFYTVVGVVFVIFVHGPHFFLPLLIIIANYVIFSRLQRWCPYWLFMVIMWAAHVTLLYLIEINDGFEQTPWLQYYTSCILSHLQAIQGDAEAIPWEQRMRWCVAFRMSTLRLIAFNYDLWEATHAAARARDRARAKHDTGCVECAQLREQNAASAAALPAEALRCYKYRTEYARDPADYNFLNYAAYVLFPPLYLAGPMSSFNAFVSHMRVPSTSMPLRKMVRYAFGILRIYITEYTLLHFVHIPCLGSYAFVILRMTLLEQAHFLFYMLAYLWLKFSFIWKSSRLFAMFSGIEVPEDMRRCFGNTLTVRGFWRDWHASFNLWIVRYMYIPMGGRSRVALSVLPIFLFIAVWHDPALHLVKWAVCIAAMFVAEVAVSGCFGWAAAAFRREMAAAAPTGAVSDAALENGRPTNCAPRRSLLARLARLSARRLSPLAQSWVYRQFRVIAGMTTVLGLIIANLVGFSMQNAVATVEKHGLPSSGTDADNVIKKAFHGLTPLFTLGLIAFMYSMSALAAMDRDMARQQASYLKLLYRLKQ